MTPDYLKAATAATETLIKYNVTATPVSPLSILEKIPGVLVVSYESLSNEVDQDRSCVISLFHEMNQDAFTTVIMKDGKPQYIVTYNQRLPVYILHRALARELGHIVLGHVGDLPEDVRNEEAKCFTHHLLTPRALIHAIQATGLRFTTEVLGNLTGCNDFCMNCMRRLPAVSVPAELNRAVREQMMPYILNYFYFQRYATHKDGSPLADLGSYMDGYEE